MAEKKYLTNAKNSKNDEFYTQYEDIQKEMNAYLEYTPDVFREKTVFLPCDDPEWSNFTRFFAQNFENFGLKKLISTSYAYESKSIQSNYQLTLFESEAPQYDKSKTMSNGKIFTLIRDKNKVGKIDIDDLEWRYLDGDGDFRSDEVKALRDEADIIITNPPFSLFREFLEWIMEANKNFVIIGNQNAITYKEVFPLIQQNRVWLGKDNGGTKWFQVPNDYHIETKSRTKIENGIKYFSMGSIMWFTNLEHGKRHQPLQLMTMEDNLKFSKHKEIKEKGYQKFDNYNAINVPYTDSIPKDYEGDMAVPVTFLDKYCPEQFELVDALNRYALLDKQNTNDYVQSIKSHTCNIDGKPTYFRVVIRLKK
jgi:hypothetical protein